MLGDFLTRFDGDAMNLTKTFLTVLLVLISGNSVAQDKPPFHSHSFADTSCGAWVKSTGDQFNRALYLYWFRGFVSGYNFGNPDNQVPLGVMPNQETLSLYVDKYCRENPLNPFVFAAFNLVEELRENPSTQKRGPSKK